MGNSIKEYKSADELIEILKKRNLNISSPLRAKRILTENNYFFLKGYNTLFLSTRNLLGK